MTIGKYNYIFSNNNYGQTRPFSVIFTYGLPMRRPSFYLTILDRIFLQLLTTLYNFPLMEAIKRLH